MKKVNILLLILMCLLVSCSSEKAEDMVCTYTGARLTMNPGGLKVQELFFDEDYQNYMRDFGAVLTMDNDTAYYLGTSSMTTSDDFTLSISGNRGDLLVVSNHETTHSYRNAETYVLRFTDGVFDLYGRMAVVCKDSVYYEGNPGGWRLLLDDYKLVMHKWKGDKYDKTEKATISYSAWGVVDDGILSLNKNDTAYIVKDIGANEVVLRMIAPSQDEIRLTKR